MHETKPPTPNPITPPEFEALMAPLGPHGASRRVIAAVSGGADSMALATLLRHWGNPLAIVIDHGLRPAAADEAALTIRRLAAQSIEARLVTLAIPRGPDLGARARHARYDALFAVCRGTGCPDLLVAHHAGDDAETIHLRAAAGSGPAGLAGIAPIAWRADARILRPLLPIHPGRLRATLRAHGSAWVEDPTNRDPTTARGALRTSPPPPLDPTPLATRIATDAAIAFELARTVTLYPAGIAAIAGPLSPAAWSALVWTLSGRRYPPPMAGTVRLAGAGQGTLHGVRIHAGWAARESASLQPSIPAQAGIHWDDRFLLHRSIDGATIGPLGPDAARLRRRPGPPSSALRTLPALRVGTDLLAVPHLAYPDVKSCLSVDIEFRPTRPMAGLFAATA